MTEVEARRHFDPYIEWFQQCWWNAWDWYHKPTVCDPFDDSRARATMIQNRAIVEATKTFGGQLGVKRQEFISRRLFIFGDWAVVQFKKLDEKLCSNNSPNDTSDAFDSQQSLPGLIEVPRFTVGYCPNESHTNMDLYITHPKNRWTNNWAFEISGRPTLMTIPLFDETDAQATPPARRVRPRVTSGDSNVQGNAEA